MKKAIKRFTDFLQVIWYILTRGFSSSKLLSLSSMFFEALSFFWVISAATFFAVLASADRPINLPEQLMQYIPETKVFAYGVAGFILSMLAGALSKFLSNYTINLALPKVESKFYKESIHNFAKANIQTLSYLDIEPADYLKRELNVNTRYTMMVYRRLALTIIPFATLLLLLPVLAMKSLTILLAMVLVLLLLIPIYYWINKRSNQITLDMETLTREVSKQRKNAAMAIFDTDYNSKLEKNTIAPTLARNNADVREFFHMYGERFTMSEATNFTNTLVLLLLIGVLAFFTLADGGQNTKNINTANFIIVLVVLRQVHTVVSRGLMVTNIMSRFYTKLLTMKSVNEKLSKMSSFDTQETSETMPSSFKFCYKHMLTKQLLKLDMKRGNVHLMYDNDLPSRLTVLGLRPETDVNDFRTYISTHTVKIVLREDQEFSFADYKDDKQALERVIDTHMPLLSKIFDETELQHKPDSKLNLKTIIMSSLGKGISYLRPRTIKTYELMIDLQQKLKRIDADIIFLDVRTLMLFQSPYDKIALDIMKSLDKLIIVLLAKQNYNNFSFEPTRPVIVSSTAAKTGGYVTFFELKHVVNSNAAIIKDELDDEMNI